jgi:hypothetical protein
MVRLCSNERDIFLWSSRATPGYRITVKEGTDSLRTILSKIRKDAQRIKSTRNPRRATLPGLEVHAMRLFGHRDATSLGTGRVKCFTKPPTI